MCDHTIFLHLQITNQSTVKRAVSVVTDDHFNLPQKLVWACIVSHTHFNTPQGWSS